MKKTEFYLVTGFLGAGKTTFLKNFIRLFPGKRLRLIINEFGREGVDGKLLDEIGATLHEVNGGSIFCSCRLDKFEEALEEGLADHPDLLIVEASGLSDPTNIRKILEQREQEGQLTYKGCVCIVDAARLKKVFSTARVCPKQLNVGDLILINKTDLATPEELRETRDLILSRYPAANLQETAQGRLSPQWIESMQPCRRPEDMEANRPDITTQRASATVNPEMSAYELERFIGMFAEETSRVKGFIYLKESGWLLADCVGSLLRITPWQGPEPAESLLNILATGGTNLRKALKQAAAWYPDKITVQFG